MGAISSLISGVFQSGGAAGAARGQQQSAERAIAAQLQMWNQARADFAPYLRAGSQGLSQLRTAMPNYVQQNVIPAMQAYGAFTPSALPSANFSVDPVTGQVRQAQAQFNQVRQAQAQFSQVPGSVQQQQQGPMAAQGMAPGVMEFRPTARTTLQQQAMAAPTATAGPANLTQGGVLSPTVPMLQQDLSYQFNTDDPVYQQKLSEKNKQIDAFLAKQGLQGSSAGESFRQEQINALLAEEEQRQYNRAVSERDYATQTTAQQYGLEAQRGESLYNRVYGQQADVYNRLLQNVQLTNQQNAATLANRYSLAQDVYGTLYGGALDLAKIGAGAAGSAGTASMTTGQGIAQSQLYAGNAQAQGQLAQGQAMAGAIQGIANAPLNAYSMYQAYAPTQYYNPSAYSQPSYGQYGYLAGSGVQYAPTHVGAGGTTAFGM